jgi:HEPN domain-containing protein
MNDVVKKWLRKAEDDFDTAKRELAVNDDPNYDAVCFHSQQCIEKTIKALLIKYKVEFPKIHDLSRLADLLKPYISGCTIREEQLEVLTDLGLSFRYPEAFADKEDAAEAFKLCSILREGLQAYFN